MAEVNKTPTPSYNRDNACVVSDGETLALYARPCGEVLAELNALDKTDCDNPDLAYSLWCSEHYPDITTGNGAAPAAILDLEQECGLPRIRYDCRTEHWGFSAPR